MFSAGGRLLRKERVNSSIYKINISSFASGMYHLFVTDAKGKAVISFIYSKKTGLKTCLLFLKTFVFI
ncbi:MAG: hypothetical protein EOP53_11865 [Sphingobacteriales bacterium]|nr:MAG: hypothetical protein EOP53_11865 [Sphingobacteriales bacterium]